MAASLLVIAVPAAAQAVDVLGYMLATPGTCTAGDWTSPNASWYTSTLDETTCPGRTLLLHYKGLGAFAFEVFDVSDQWIRLISETLVDQRTADVDRARVFYRQGVVKGLDWIPRLATGGESWRSGWWAQRWYDGVAACAEDSQPPANFPLDAGMPETMWLRPVPNFMWDHRPRHIVPGPGGTGGSQTGPFGPYPITMVVMNQVWGDNSESYGYGRWVDPVDGVERGLGLVYYEMFHLEPDCNGCPKMWKSVGGGAEWRHLVPCDSQPTPCFRCPDTATQIILRAPAPHEGLAAVPRSK